MNESERNGEEENGGEEIKDSNIEENKEDKIEPEDLLPQSQDELNIELMKKQQVEFHKYFVQLQMDV
jgi:hypothetical protein